jgi:competence protein ComEA
MSSLSGPIPIRQERDLASRVDTAHWIWPAGSRAVLAVVVIASALGLAIASQSVPESGAEIVRAPDLLLDLNTAPPRVLETLPHVGQTLVRQVVAARELRPLVSLDDAGRRVRGLGPSTLAQIAPYLRFEGAETERIADSESAFRDRPSAKPRATGRKTTRSRKQKTPPLQPRLVSNLLQPRAQ